MYLTLPILRPNGNTSLFADLLVKQGKQPRHKLVILTTEEQLALADEVQNKIDGLFAGVQRLIVPSVVGDVAQMNKAFQRAAEYFLGLTADRLNALEAWFWCEPEVNVPLRGEWLNLLQDEYQVGRRPCMGVREPLWERKGDDDWKEAGAHLCRSSIYPLNLKAKSTMMKFLYRSFDLEMQWEILGSEKSPNATESRLMQHNFGTCKYRVGKKGLECDDTLPEDFPTSYAREIREDVVLLQGCFDESLLKLVLGGAVK